MTIESVEKARAEFRGRHISNKYSGPLHLATTTAVCLLSEYLGHKGPMHHRTRFLGLIFERHTIEHHAFFTDEAATFDTSQDYKAVLFPPIMLLFFNGCFAKSGHLVRYSVELSCACS